MTLNDTTSTGGSSRREAMKKLTLGTALVWAAPAILSSGKAAAAGSVAEPVCPGSCGGVTLCGEDGNNVDGNCYKFEEGCECWSNIFCNQSPACTTTSECPPNWICITTCCGKSCIPLCGTTHLAAGVGSGRTAIG